MKKNVWVLGGAFLLVNALGWWWAGSARRSVENGGEAAATNAVTVAEEVAKPEWKVFRPNLVSVKQVSLTSDRLLTLRFTFSRPVDWQAFGAGLRLSAGNSRINWRFSGTPTETEAMVKTDDNVYGTSLSVQLPVPTTAEGEDLSKMWEKDVNLKLEVVPNFRLAEVSSWTPAFAEPEVKCRFTQPVNLESVEEHLTVEPKVAYTVSTSDSYWDDGSEICLTGKFEPGKRYKVLFRKGLAGREGQPLEQDAWREVELDPRPAELEIAASGRYLAPHGRLTIPVMTMNQAVLTCKVSRVLSQNIVQLAMRETDGYSHWRRNYWSSQGENQALADSLTEAKIVRSYRLNAKEGEIGKAAVNLADFLDSNARGIFLLQVNGYVEGHEDDESYYQDCLVCVTDLGLNVRRSGDDITAWVVSLGTGKPVAECEVSAYAKNGSRVAHGVTDAQGIWTFKPGDTEEVAPFVLVAERKADNDRCYLPLSFNAWVEQPVSASRSYLGPKACEAFVMTDRDIYRPGEKVFVQGLVRTWENRAPEPFPLELAVLLPDTQLYKKFPVKPDELGVVVSEVEMPAYLRSGNYTIELKIPGEKGAILGERTFRIESFVPPQTRLALKGLPEQIPLTNTEVAVSLYAEHLFGKPAGGLLSMMTAKYFSSDFKPAGWERYRFGDTEREKISLANKLEDIETDEAGVSAYTVPLNRDVAPPAAMTLRLQGRVREVSGRTVSASEDRIYHIYPFYVGIKPPESAGITLGSPASVQVALVDPAGKRVETVTRLETKLERVKWINALRKGENGRYKWESERLKNVVSTGEVTVSGGQDTEVPFTVPLQGDYILTVTDPATKSASCWSFWVGADGQFAGEWDRSKPEKVEIVFDKKVYVPGDTARIQLRAPFSGGTAWVALQRTRIFENWVIPMTNNTAEITVKVVEAFAPNVEIAVSMIRPAVAESTWSAHRATGIEPLRVAPPSRQLDVVVAAGPSPVLPAREMPVKVTVRQFDGKVPEKAAVTVMAVDEGICLLTGYKTPVPNDFFFAVRASGIELFDVYRNLMPVTDEKLWGSASHVGGDGDDEMLIRLNPVAARRFKPLALWQGNVALDAEGQATVSLPLPEFSGELRVMAVAWSGVASGSGDCAVKVKRPVVVQPDLPRMLAPGDRTAMTVGLHNESGADQSVELLFTTEGPVAFDEAKKSVKLPAGASQVVTVPVVAADRIGTGRFTVKATGFGEPYEETLELAVRPAAPWLTRFENVDVAAGKSTVFSLPAEALEGSCRQELTCFTLGKVDLIGALDYVTTYPYGCLEQTVSSVFPAMMLDARQRALWLEKSSLANELERLVKEAFVRIRSMRRYGGYAMWPDVQRVSPKASLYAGLFMAGAVRKGIKAISEKDLQECLSLLAGMVSNGDGIDDEIRAYYCHVAALAGQPDVNLMTRLQEWAENGEASICAKVHLARALALAGRTAAARPLLSDSEKAESMEGLAFGLVTWLELDPASPKVRAIRKKIDAARNARFGHWGTTQDNALATLALAAYDRHFGSDQDRPFKVQAQWAEGSSTSGENVKSWKLKGAPDAEAKATTLKNFGPGVVSVARRLSYVPKAGALPAASRGLKVGRKWFDVAGNERLLGDFKRGDQVIVEITVNTLGKAYDDLVVQDLLPAGLEIEQVNLAKADTLPWIEEKSHEWVVHAEARDDRLLIFGGSQKKDRDYTYYYAARVVSAGTFTIPAISVERMYDPEVYGRTAAAKTTVKE